MLTEIAEIFGTFLILFMLSNSSNTVSGSVLQTSLTGGENYKFNKHINLSININLYRSYMKFISKNALCI